MKENMGSSECDAVSCYIKKLFKKSLPLKQLLKGSCPEHGSLVGLYTGASFLLDPFRSYRQEYCI